MKQEKNLLELRKRPLLVTFKLRMSTATRKLCRPNSGRKSTLFSVAANSAGSYSLPLAFSHLGVLRQPTAHSRFNTPVHSDRCSF
jgi:hypothetical protein